MNNLSTTFVHVLFLILLLLQKPIPTISSSDSNSDSSSDSSGSSSSDESSNPIFYDYVIVGGGPAGLSTMAFLNKQEPSSTVLVLEKLGRIGGRQFTTYLTHNDKTIHFEHNAMRFRINGYLYHVLTMTNLCDDISFMNGAGVNRTYNYRNLEVIRSVLRPSGSTFSDELDNYFHKIYNFTDNDINLLLNGAENTLRDEFLQYWNNGSHPEDYDEWIECLTEWTIDNIPVKDWTPLAIYLSYFNCSIEYINYRYDNQYPPFWDNSYTRVCRNPISNDPFERPDGMTGGQKTLANGFSQITQKLLELGTDYGENNNDLYLNTEVMGVEYTSDYFDSSDSFDSSDDYDINDYKYFIRIRDPRDWTKNNDNIDNDDYPYIFTKNVIFSIPTRNFKKLFPSISPWRNDKYIYELIDARGMVEYGYRVNLIYDDQDVADNFEYFESMVQSKTDFLLRSVYFDKNWKNDTLFAIQFYCRVEQAVWLHNLQSVGPAYINPNGDVFELDESSKINAIYSSRVLVERVVSELSDLVNYDFPLPLAAFSQPLGLNDSNVDGLYLNKNGYIASQTYDSLRHPKQNENLYVASGTYSSWTVDIEGAIEAAYKLVHDTFNLGDPFENVEYCFI